MTNIRFKSFASGKFAATNVAAGDLAFIAGGTFSVGGVTYSAPAIVKVSSVSGTTVNGTVFRGTDTWPAITAGTATLAFGDSATLATIGGTAITVTMPSLPAGASKEGTVTSITAGEGLAGGTITSSGTISHGAVGDVSATAAAGSGNYVSGVQYDKFGHVVGVVTGAVPTSLKNPQAITIQGQGTSLTSYNGATARTYNVTGSNGISVSGSGTTLTISGNTAWVTGGDVDTAIGTALSDLSGALKYKGTVTASSALPALTAASTGDVYVAASAFTLPTASSAKGSNQALEIGDYIIFNGSKWDAINGENQVSADVASNATGVYTIGTVDGVTLYGKDTNTTYAAEKGITLASGKFGHSNEITAETSGIGSKTSNVAFDIISGLKYDAQGHITSAGTSSISLGGAATYSVGSVASGNTGLVTGGAVYTAIANKGVGVTSITAGEGLAGSTITSSGTISHATAYTAGATHNAGTGKYISKITYDKFGHVTKIEDGTLPTFSEAHLGDIVSVTGAANSNVSATNSSNAVTVDLTWIEYS